MATKNQKNEKTNKPVKKTNTTSYKNPSDTVWGKIVLWLIIFGMVGIIIVSLILTILKSNA